MSPRPKNPPPDRRREILDAALLVFARRGYAAATNAEIAREAGVTAAALYYYFPSKAELFRATISDRQGQIMPSLQQVGEQMKEVPPDIVLPFVVERMLNFLNDDRTQAIVRIVLAEGPRNPEVAAIWQEQVLGRMLPVLLGYLQHQMEQGTIRKVDPRILLLMVNGTAFTTFLVRDLIKVPLLQDLGNQEVAQQLTQTLLNGLLAKGE